MHDIMGNLAHAESASQMSEATSCIIDELNQIGIKIDMYRQEYRFTPAFAFIQAV